MFGFSPMKDITSKKENMENGKIANTVECSSTIPYSEKSSPLCIKKCK